MNESGPGDSPQTALLTGASVGIGLELGKLLAADGRKLILVARDIPKLEKVAAMLRQAGSPDVRVLPSDLSQPEAPEKIAAELAADKVDVDILVNNAGFGTQGSFQATDLRRQLDLVQVNITALTHLTHLFLPGMITRRRGKIMNLASVAAFVPGPYMACYFASKAYVMSFSLALSEECRTSGVTVTCVCPGPTRTEFFTRAGVIGTPMDSGPMMSAQSVARIGYGAMLAGKPLVVTGLNNKVMALASRLAPRMLVARAIGERNQRRTVK